MNTGRGKPAHPCARVALSARAKGRAASLTGIQPADNNKRLIPEQKEENRTWHPAESALASSHQPTAVGKAMHLRRCFAAGGAAQFIPGSLSDASFSRRFAPDADLCGTRHVAVSSQPLQPLERHVPVHDARARAVNPLHSRLAVCCAQQYSWLATVFDVLTILSTSSQCSTFAALDKLATRHHRRGQLRQQPPAAATLNACGVCLLHCASSRLCGTRFCCAGVCSVLRWWGA